METAIIPICEGVELALASWREAGQDGGPSISVFVGTDPDKQEALRFDVFKGRPHYHYLRPGREDLLGEQYDISSDPVIIGNRVEWVLDQIAHRLPDMLAHAGYPEVAQRIHVDMESVEVEDAIARASEFFVANVVS